MTDKTPGSFFSQSQTENEVDRLTKTDRRKQTPETVVTGTDRQAERQTHTRRPL